MDYLRLYENEDLESKICNIVYGDEDYIDALRKNNFYELHYFLSPLRHDLFKWYPFKEDGSLLEIGASYGQLTSLFTSKVDHVVAVEDRKIKCDIISKRAENATVLLSDFNDLQLDEKFDYIVLCNIFEYAKSFYDSENPYVDYLNYLKGFLKEDGVILMALSNRLGLKYFAGFKEEHTSQYFTGIEGYKNIDYVQTFSKPEITNIIENAGFSNYKFFYVYPDHVFTEVITTDKLINKMPFNGINEYADERILFFDEIRLNLTLSQDNMSQYFANSFLIEIRSSDMNYLTDKINYIKAGSQRKEEFQIFTTIWDDGKVSKSPGSPKANAHVKRMFDECKGTMGKIRCLDAEMKGDTLYYDFLNEHSYESMIMEALIDDDKDKFFKLLEDFYDALFYGSFESDEYANEEFLSVFKDKSDIKFHCHEKTYLDLNLGNIFMINGEFICVDYEWIFDFKIPLEYIFFRTINHHLFGNKLIHEFTNYEEIFDHFNLDIKNRSLFQGWECDFLRYILERPPFTKSKIITLENIEKYDNFEEYVNKYNYMFSRNLNPYKWNSFKREIIMNQQKDIDLKNKEIKRKNKELKKKNKEIESLLNSKSWKITKPLRKVKSIIKRQ